MSDECIHEMNPATCAWCAPPRAEPSAGVVREAVRVDVEDIRITIARETERLMPELFVSRYAELVFLASGVPLGGATGEPGMPLSGLEPPSSAYGRVIRNPVAHRYRQAVDGRLRALSRDVREFLVTSDRERRGIVERVTRRCANCKKFVDADWRHCAWCGAKQSQPEKGKK